MKRQISISAIVVVVILILITFIFNVKDSREELESIKSEVIVSENLDVTVKDIWVYRYGKNEYVYILKKDKNKEHKIEDETIKNDLDDYIDSSPIRATVLILLILGAIVLLLAVI